MDLAHRNVVLTLGTLQYLIRSQKRVVRTERHLTSADEIHHQHAPACRVIDAPPFAGRLRRQIGGTQNIAVVLQIRNYLPLIPNMVAKCNHIGSGIENIVRLRGGYPYPRGILSVYNHKVRFMLLLQPAQPPV